MDRVSTGVEGLDKMLGGGLIAGRPYVIGGPPGSGKSILCTHFLLDGLQRGESCMIVALDEPPSEIRSNMSAFGWNLDSLMAVDATDPAACPGLNPLRKVPVDRRALACRSSSRMT